MNFRILALVLAAGFAPAAFAQNSTGYIEMPASTDGSYLLTSGPGSGRHWGRPETIHFLLLVAREWHARHGDSMVLRIGDISKPDGSSFPPHKTHMDGLAIDVVTSNPNITRIEFAEQEKTLELARLMVEYGARQILYNHKYVIDRVPEVEHWEKHDDHFHVVVDPDRVPKGEGPFLVEAMKGWLGLADMADEKGNVAGPEIRWSYLAPQRGWQRAYRIRIDRDGSHEEFDHDTGWVRSVATAGRVDAMIEDGRTIHYAVEVEGPAGERLEIPWRALRADFRDPELVAKSPLEDEEIASNPVFSWTWSDVGEQVAHRIEVDENADHSRVGLVLDRVEGAQASRELEVPLRAGRTYWWRVVAEDEAGNEGATEWRSFRTARDYRGGDLGKVKTDGLNFRSGPGTDFPALGELDRGAEVEILERKGEWLRVRYVKGRKAWIGWVHSDYVED